MAAKPNPMAVSSVTETELKAKCPSDTIVWVNTSQKIYQNANESLAKPQHLGAANSEQSCGQKIPSTAQISKAFVAHG
jgi:hypothetical protein